MSWKDEGVFSLEFILASTMILSLFVLGLFSWAIIKFVMRFT